MNEPVQHQSCLYPAVGFGLLKRTDARLMRPSAYASRAGRVTANSVIGLRAGERAARPATGMTIGANSEGRLLHPRQLVSP